MLSAWYAWTRLLLEVVCLRLTRDIVTRAAGSATGMPLVGLVTALGSIGIYLGRLLGQNGWGVFEAPPALADTACDRAKESSADVRMLGLTVLFALLFLFVYVAVHVIGTPTVERA